MKKLLAGFMLLSLTFPVWADNAVSPEMFQALQDDCDNVADNERWRLQIAACRILLSQPHDADVLSEAAFQLGYSLDELGRKTEALAALDMALEYDPDRVDALSNRGLIHRQMGNNHRAIADYTRAIEIDPDNFNAHVNLGVAYLHEQRFQAALASYTKAAELRPKHIGPHVNMALAYRQMGKLSASLTAYENAIERDPKNLRLRVNRGVTLQDLGRYSAARQAYEQVIAQDPDRANVHQLLMILLGLGPEVVRDLPTAIQHGITYRQARPDDFETICQLAVIQTRAGRADAAFVSHKHIIDGEPAYAGHYLTALQQMGHLANFPASWDAAADAALRACLGQNCEPFSN